MKTNKWLARALALSLFWTPIPAITEDIDIFTGGSIAASNPSILFVLDNTSNWARQSQQWPGGVQQGQSEANAIKSLINSSAIDSGINMGIMEFVTEGNASNTGGFVRFPILPMTDTNKTALATKLDTIYSGVNSPSEKRNSNTEYGNLLYDVYNYLTGSAPYDSLNPPNADAAGAAYTTPYSLFSSPITADNGCGRIFMVFIGNPNASGPADDSTANKTTLGTLGCNTTNIPLPDFSTGSRTEQVLLGEGGYASQAACEAAAAVTYGTSYESYTCSVKSVSATPTTLTTSSCGQYSSQANCEAAAASTYGSTYNSYSCEVASSCTGTSVLGTSSCGQYASAAACETGAATAFPGYSSYSCTVSASLCVGGSTVLGLTSCGQYKTQAACEAGAAATWPGYSSYTCSSTTGGAGTCTSTDLDGNACYTSSAVCKSTLEAANPGYNSVTCSSGATCDQTATLCGASTDYDSAAECSAKGTTLLPGFASYSCDSTSGQPCSPSKNWTVTGVSGTQSFSAIGSGTRWSVSGSVGVGGTRYDMTGTGPASTYTVKGYTNATTYNIYGNYTVTVSTRTGTYSSGSNMFMADEWARCLREKDLSTGGTPAASEVFKADFASSGTIVGADTITFNGATTTLAGGETPLQIANKVATTAYPDWYATNNNGVDSYVLFGRKNSGVVADATSADFSIVDAGTTGTLPVVTVTTLVQGSAATGGADGTQNVTTYTIDVFNAQQNATHTALMLSMAQQGGGRYFAANSESQILLALQQILSEIQSVNTAFAAASIPLSTTNRSQNLNEVYIGVFRPSLEPRWFGNLKKFQISTSGGTTDLVDQTGTTSALNTQTGFLNDCASSFWTTDSGNWWENVAIGGATLSDNPLLNPVPRSNCLAMPAGNTSPWSDLPDGQSVEKGAVAEVVRRGNNPPNTQTSPTWSVNRSVLTRPGSPGALVGLTSADAGSADLYDYVRGVDINVDGSHVTEKVLATAITDPVRPSVHGDVVHSRPLAVNYGTDNTTVYYGANDGMLRAVDGATGREKWAFIPPEFLEAAKQTRLMQNTPAVSFGASPATGSSPKNYLFDGSAGLWQNRDNTQVWLFPTQRRGGRMLHGIDVTSDKTASSAPTLLWNQGCPNLGDDVGCTSGFSDMGQTWSVPVVTRIKGYNSGTRPVVIVGGGYDACEDSKTGTSSNPPTWSCGSAKGRAIFVVDAQDGTLVKKFTINNMRGITAGVAVLDVNNDGYSDYAYAVDLGGAIYRMTFVESYSSTTSLPPGAGNGDNLATASEWKIQKVAYASGGRKFMFTPAVVYAGQGAIYVALGSGDRERPLIDDYPYVQTLENRVYGFRDDLIDLPADTLPEYQTPVTACHLDETIVDANSDGLPDGCVFDYTAGATCESPKIQIGASQKAWRVGMTMRGEQTVTQALIVSGLVTVNTTRPMTTGTCSASLGEGGGYFLNLLNGSGAIGTANGCGGDTRGFFTGVGLPTDPVLVNLPGKDPICIGCVSRQPANPTVGSKLFEPTPLRPTISAAKSRKYRYQIVD